MRIGLVGYGLAGRFFHAPLIASTPGASLAGMIVVRSAQPRAHLRRDHPQVPCHDSLAALLVTGLDGVVIATPPTGRQGLVLQALALACRW